MNPVDSTISNLNNPWSNKQSVKVEEILDDRISQLPDSLLVQILSVLPTKDAFITCVLSRRWRYLCTSVDNLYFSYGNQLHIRDFISSVDSALAHSTSAKIKKFQLTLCCPHEYRSQYSQWLAFAVEKKVEDIKLYSIGDDDDIFALPQSICTCSSLVTLKLIRCALDKQVILAWKSLKSLALDNMVLDDDNIVNLLSGCPALETLGLYVCMGYRHLDISSSNLKKLTIFSWMLSDAEDHDQFLEIFAPYVQHLEISGNIYDLKCRLQNVSSLVNARLTFNVSCEKDIQNYNGYQVDNAVDSCRDYHQSFSIFVQDYLQKISNVTNLTIGTWLTKVLCLLQLEGVPFPEQKCKYLALELPLENFNLYGVAGLLRASLHVETLNIDIATIKFEDTFCHFERHLAKGDDIDLQSWTSSSMFPGLKNVKIVNSFLVCLEDYFKQPYDKLFKLSEFLLKNATALEKFVIVSKTRECRRCSMNCVSQYFFRLAKNLLGCPRSSTNSVIIVEE
ncbi:unnamed protein product [Withania somnifera]